MKGKRTPLLRQLLLWLMALILLAGPPPGARAEDDPLKPPDITSADTYVTLHKQAERVGPDEWRVTVSANVKENVVEPPELEVVCVLDVSGSMSLCAEEEYHFLNRKHKYDKCPGHTHSSKCYDVCTLQNNPAHYGNGTSAGHDGGTTCVKDDKKYYRLTCSIIEHEHTADCCSCGKDHCMTHYTSGTCTYWDGTTEKNYTSRLYYAKEAIKTLNSQLDSDATVVYFSSSTTVGVATDLDSLVASGYTYLMNGVNFGIDQFHGTDTQKILVVLADGGSDSWPKYTSTKYEDFIGAGGIVFTVGFNLKDPDLSGMVANGGTYSHAASPDELEDVFIDIGVQLTAMVLDPMGPAVGFDTIDRESNEGSDVTVSTDGTLSWTPSDSTNLTGEIVKFNYDVKLNSKADTTAGTHAGIRLNNKTTFRYTVTTNGESKLYELEFPYPEAKYEVSTLQTQWQTTDGTPLTPADGNPYANDVVDQIVGCDYVADNYTHEFKAGYADIALEDTGYRYVGTKVYINDVEQTGGLELIDPTNPVAYKVVHLYEEVVPGTLTITKTVEGNIGSRNREFTFTLSAPSSDATARISKNGGALDTIILTDPYTFTLKHGESITITPIKGAFTVTETDYGGYTVSHDGTAGTSSNIAIGDNGQDKSSTINFTNTLDVPPPTGVRTPYIAALAGIFLALGLLAITLMGRRWPRIE